MRMNSLCIVTSVLMLAACGSGGGGGGTDTVTPGNDAVGGDTSSGGDASAGCGVTADNYFDRVGDALGAYFGRCTTAALAFSERPLTFKAMLNNVVEGLKAQYKPLLTSGRVTIDETAACASIEKLNQDSCATIDLSSLSLGLTGTAAAGDPCYVDEECPTGFFCKASACPGSCAAAAKAGDGCDASQKCSPGLTCGDNSLCQTKEAMTYAKAGDSCEAATAICIMSWCDGTTCRAYPGPGGECGEGAAPNCSGSYCDGSACRNYKEKNEDCERIGECADGLTCQDYKCTSMGKAGDSCAPSDEGKPSFDCESGICSENKVCTDSQPAPSCHP